MTTQPSAKLPKVQVDRQSAPFFADEGPVHRSTLLHGDLVSDFRGLKTVSEILVTAFEKNGARPCMAVREQKADGSWSDYNWTTFADVNKKTINFASGLRDLGVKAGDFVGIYSVNRPEWVITSSACALQSFIFVPLYDTLGPDAVEYVVNHSALQTIVCSAKTFPAIAACIKKCPSVKRIIIMDALESKFRVAVPETLDLYSMADVQQRGEKAPRANVMAKPDDIYTIMYTSGTTGNPKGVIITHRNIVSAAAGLNDVVELGADDVHISYLPLAHIYELVCQLVGVLDGCAVGFWRGDVAWLLEDIQALKPTILVGVPRVFNRIYDKVLAQINEGGFIKKSLFQIACSAKTSALDAGGDTPIWNKLVFEKIRQAMGGRVRLISSGSAPIGAEVQEFLRLTSGAKVVQGYGLTESCAALTVQQIADSRTAGHVGPPLRCNEVKLVDVPEMGYTSRSTPQRGEICVRGNNIFSGYYKEKEKTDEVLEPSGWFHTGDIGEWLPNGTLKVIDRKKNIFKLAQGEYVAAEYLETLFQRSKYIMQIYVYGDSFKNYLVGIAVPDPETLLPWAKQNGLGSESLASLCKHPKVKQLIYSDLASIAASAKLPHFMYIKNFYLEPEAWTVDNGLLTPSMKLKRPALKTHYTEAIDKLYQEPTLDAKAKL